MGTTCSLVVSHGVKYFCFMFLGLYAQDFHPGGLCVVSTPDQGKVYGYVPPQRVWLLRRFGLKTGIDFAHFWSGIGCGFRGNYGSV